MGSWGYTAFENDTACDWVYELEKRGFVLIEETIQSCLDEEYIDDLAGPKAVAACETICFLIGNPGPKCSYTKSMEIWVAQHAAVVNVSPELKSKAQQVLVLVQDIDQSELAQEWDEDKKWQEAILDIKARLRYS